MLVVGVVLVAPPIGIKKGKSEYKAEKLAEYAKAKRLKIQEENRKLDNERNL